MKYYQQTTNHTGAAASLLTILHHFNKATLTREEEFTIWQQTANLPVLASSIYALAIIAKNKGLTPTIVLEEKEYDYPDYRFKGYTKQEIEEAKYSSKLFAKRATKQDIPITQRPITIEEVTTLLNNNKILLLRINAGTIRNTGSTSKYVVAYQEKAIIIIDPEHGKQTITKKELEEAMTTLHTKKKRDVRMIIF